MTGGRISFYKSRKKEQLNDVVLLDPQMRLKQRWQIKNHELEDFGSEQTRVRCASVLLIYQSMLKLDKFHCWWQFQWKLLHICLQWFEWYDTAVILDITGKINFWKIVVHSKEMMRCALCLRHRYTWMFVLIALSRTGQEMVWKPRKWHSNALMQFNFFRWSQHSCYCKKIIKLDFKMLQIAANKVWSS